METVKLLQINDTLKTVIKNDKKVKSEILLLTNENPLYFVTDNNSLCEFCSKNQLNGFLELDIPFDICLTKDSNSIDITQYKLFVFSDTFNIDASLSAFIDELKASGKTVLWIYAPGFSSEGLSGIQKLTDINIVQLIGDEDSVHTHFGTLKYEALPYPRFFIEDNDVMPLAIYPNTEKVAIGMKRFSDWTSIYSAVGNLNAELLLSIADIAGIKTE